MNQRTLAAGFVLGSFVAPLALGSFAEANPHPVDQVNQSVMVYSVMAGNNNNATAQFPQTPSKTIEPLHYNFRHLIPAGNNSNSTETI